MKGISTVVDGDRWRGELARTIDQDKPIFRAISYRPADSAPLPSSRARRGEGHKSAQFLRFRSSARAKHEIETARIDDVVSSRHLSRVGFERVRA